MDNICYIQYRFDIPFFENCVRMMDNTVGLVIYDYSSLSQNEKDTLEKETNIVLYKNIAETAYRYSQYIIPQQSIIKQTLLVEIIYDLLEHGKTIQCFKRITNEDELGRILSKYGERFLYFPQIYKSNYEISIDCPVIYICSDHTESRKTDIQIRLNTEFKKNGAVVSNISYDEWTELLEYHKIPWEVLNPEIRIEEKNSILKRFIEHIVSADVPDVIIFNMPGNMIPFDKDVANTSSLANYFSSIIKPDYVIFSLMSLDYKQINHQINYVNCLMKKEIDEVILTDDSINLYKYNEEQLINVIKFNKIYVNKNYKEILDKKISDYNIYLYHADGWEERTFNNFFAKFAVNKNEGFSIIE